MAILFVKILDYCNMNKDL